MPLNPGKEALHQPASFIPTQSSPVLGLLTVFPVQRDHLNAILRQLCIQLVAIDFDAFKSDHTQEIVDVVLVARDQAAKQLQPSEQTLDCPARRCCRNLTPSPTLSPLIG